jgi:hypothetical protein
MSEYIRLDLGEYGEILVQPSPPLEAQGGVVQAGRVGDAARKAGEAIKVSAQKLLRLPLTGLAKVFLATLPEPTEDDRYVLDGFTVEFELGVEAETGSNLGAVAVVKPNGGFKCSYTWKCKQEENKS